MKGAQSFPIAPSTNNRKTVKVEKYAIIYFIARKTKTKNTRILRFVHRTHSRFIYTTRRGRLKWGEKPHRGSPHAVSIFYSGKLPSLIGDVRRFSKKLLDRLYRFDNSPSEYNGNPVCSWKSDTCYAKIRDHFAFTVKGAVRSHLRHAARFKPFFSKLPPLARLSATSNFIPSKWNPSHA